MLKNEKQKFLNLYQVKKNQIKMMIDRGYDGKEELEELGTFQDFRRNNDIDYDTARAAQKRIYYRGEHKIIVKYLPVGEKSTLSSKEMEEFLPEKEFRENEIIGISLLTIKSDKKKIMVDTTSQIFYDRELKRRIIDHISVPKHIKLTDNEKSSFLREKKITLEQLPKLGYREKDKSSGKLPTFLPDPIVKYYNWKKGDVIKIIRKEKYQNTLVNTQIYYRVVWY